MDAPIHGIARRATVAALAVVLPLAAAACATGARPRAAAPRPDATPPQTTPRPAQTDSGQVPIGVFTENQDSGGWHAIAAFSAQAGQPVRYVLAFVHGGQPFPTILGALAARHGAELVLQLEPDMAMQQVVAGEDDGYLSSLAEQVRQYRRPVVASFAPEANGDWYSWGYSRTPASVYLAAWAHVMARFAAARNIMWMDTINVTYEGAGPTADYVVPGVSMIGIDGYFEHPGVTFSDLFGLTISQIRAVTDKPIMISETAVGQGNQTQGIPELVRGVRASHLAGFIWFNEDLGSVGGVQGQNWTLTPAGAMALRSALQQGQASPAVLGSTSRPSGQA